MNLNKIKKFKIPRSPGCYKFLDSKDKIIYIGKAANLAGRVLSYWQKSAAHSSAKCAMLKRVKKIEIIKTDSEIEALLLEANLIKKHKPEFNIAMRDDKRFVYIKVSQEEEWPRVFMTRQIEKSGRYFGPFVSAQAVRETLKVIRKIWPYRSCRAIPKRVCLYYRIGKCPGMCEGRIARNAYMTIVRNIVLFLENKKGTISKKLEVRSKRLTVQMKKLKLDSKEYMCAAEELQNVKYQLINLKKVLEHSNILSLADKYAADVIELAKVLRLPKAPERIEGYDISNILGQQAVGSMVVFSGGEPNKSEYRKFKIKIGEGEANDIGMLKEILERRIKNKWPLPDLIVVDGGKPQLNAMLRVLKKYKLEIFVIAISKGAGLRSAGAPDKIFFPREKNPLELPIASPALHLLKRVRDEAHRFAISYHRKLRMIY